MKRRDGGSLNKQLFLRVSTVPADAAVLGFLMLSSLCATAGPVPSVRIELPDSSGPIMQRAASIFTRQLAERCDAKVVAAGEAAYRIQLAIRPPEVSDDTKVRKTYSTEFDGAESPLSEAGAWRNNGLDWTQITKKNGIACGTQSGTNTGIYRYDDSYAHLSGFPPDQEAWGEVRILKPNASCNQELEILLRFTSAPHRTTGYECFARCINNASSYLQIVRWDGPLGKFTYLADKRGTNYGLNDGDVLKASVIGNVIKVYVNGVEKARAIDDTCKTGNPGIGEFLSCPGGQGVGSNSDFGFASFTARAVAGTSSNSTSVGKPTPIERPLRASKNPHYFEDATGHALILCGSQTWNTLQDWGTSGSVQPLDFDVFVNFLKNGHRGPSMSVAATY